MNHRVRHRLLGPAQVERVKQERRLVRLGKVLALLGYLAEFERTFMVRSRHGSFGPGLGHTPGA